MTLDAYVIKKADGGFTLSFTPSGGPRQVEHFTDEQELRLFLGLAGVYQYAIGGQALQAAYTTETVVRAVGLMTADGDDIVHLTSHEGNFSLALKERRSGRS